MQLTDALCKVLKNKVMAGALVNGNSYDVGIPKAYAETIEKYFKE